MEIAVWMDARGMLYTEAERESGKYTITSMGTCKNRYQMEKYLKENNLYEEYVARKKPRRKK